jgi:hypothetical protein
MTMVKRKIIGFVLGAWVLSRRVRTILTNIFRPSMTYSDRSDENEWIAFLLHYPAAVLITMCSVKLSFFLYMRTTACGIYGLNFYVNQLINSMLPEKYSYFIEHELSWFYRGHRAVFLKTCKTIRHKQPHLFLPHYMKPNPHSVSAILWYKTHQLFSVGRGCGKGQKSFLTRSRSSISCTVFKVSIYMYISNGVPDRNTIITKFLNENYKNLMNFPLFWLFTSRDAKITDDWIFLGWRLVFST